MGVRRLVLLLAMELLGLVLALALFSACYRGVVQDELWGAGVGAEAQVKRRLMRKR